MSGTTLGTWLTRPDLAIAEACARHPAFDWLVIDMEHTPITTAQAEGQLRVVQSHGKRAYVRMPSLDPPLIGKMLDLGADGIIVPMVNTAEEAARAVQACFYPPRGRRGVGLSRAQAYTAEGFVQYRKTRHDDLRVIVQIEHCAALPNLREIFAVQGLYGFFIGPYDLSASLGRPGDFACDEMRQAMANIRDVGRAAGLVAGLHVVEPDPAEVQRRISEGYGFIAVSFDMLFLIRSLEATLNPLAHRPT